MKMKIMINMAADRAAFIDQSQSFNIFVGEPNFAKLTAIHFYGWKKVGQTRVLQWVVPSVDFKKLAIKLYLQFFGFKSVNSTS